MDSRGKKIAIVYDKVNTFGGAERVLMVLNKMFPDANLLSSVYLSPKEISAQRFNQPQADSQSDDKMAWTRVFIKIIPSFINLLPGAKKHNHWYTWLMPVAFESLPLKSYDLVISVTSGEAKGIVTNTSTKHICYCLTPTRYLWSDPGYDTYRHFGYLNWLVDLVKQPLLSYLRLWDFMAAQRADDILTISSIVNRRIKKYYKRDSIVIFPPVDTDFFCMSKKNIKLKEDEKYYLVVSRLVPYKKVDLVIKTCCKLNRKLLIAGDGPELSNLIDLVSKYNGDLLVKFLGKVSDKQLRFLYQRCEALIMPQEEDFGIVALETQACGRPVIAFGSGGAIETVLEGRTGVFFYSQTEESMQKGLLNFEDSSFAPQVCRKNALRFSSEVFQNRFLNYIRSDT